MTDPSGFGQGLLLLGMIWYSGYALAPSIDHEIDPPTTPE
jgi:hypothetical protein